MTFAAPQKHRTPALVQRVLKSPAAPLDAKTRAFFEPRFGHDLSRVRVHSDAEAARSARAVNASAYTVGQHIAFDSGQFQPHTHEGQRLLAHELAHTVQQKQAGTGSDRLPIGAPSNTFEKEADHAASQTLSQGPVAVQSNAPLSLQRQVKPDASPTVDLPSLDVGLAESATPFMAASIGSVTIDHFVTGKSDISAENDKQLAHTAETILTLLKKYPAASISVTGHTDAVGQESDNQALGQARADATKASLVSHGVPGGMMAPTSRGESELLIKTKNAEPRNRRVEVHFQPGRQLPHIMMPGPSSSISPTSPQQTPSVIPDLRKIGPNTKNCIESPDQCPPGWSGPRNRQGPPMTTVPSNIPYELMDVAGINDNYTSHGQRPGDGLRETWGKIWSKYYYQYHFSREMAAKAANSEMSGTAGADQSRDNPNKVDDTNNDMKRGYPNSTGVGPFNLPWKLPF